jgi:hypothetical protein
MKDAGRTGKHVVRMATNRQTHTHRIHTGRQTSYRWTDITQVPRQISQRLKKTSHRTSRQTS